MIITFELSPDIEEELRADVAKHDAEAVRRLLTEALAPTLDATVDALLRNLPQESVRRSDRLTDKEFEALTNELVTMLPLLSPLSDYAVSREGVYAGHP